MESAKEAYSAQKSQPPHTNQPHETKPSTQPRLPTAPPNFQSGQLVTPLLNPAQVSYLQRTVGNQRVAQLLEPHRQQPTTVLRLQTMAPQIQRWPWSKKNKASKSKGKGKELEFSGDKNSLPVHISSPTDVSSTVDQDEFDEDDTEEQIRRTHKAIPEEVINSGDEFTLTLAVDDGEPDFIKKSYAFVLNKIARGLKLTKKTVEAPTQTGHAWVELRIFKDKKRIAYDSYGFSHGGVEHPDFLAGTIGEGSLYKDYSLSKTAFKRVVAKAEQIKAQQPKYEGLGFNCAKFARELVHAAGKSYPGYRAIRGIPFTRAGAFTPSRLYEALAKQQKKGKVYQREEPDLIEDYLRPTEPEDELESSDTLTTESNDTEESQSPEPTSTDTTSPINIGLPKKALVFLEAGGSLEDALTYGNIPSEKVLTSLTASARKALAALMGIEPNELDEQIAQLVTN